MKVTSTKTVSFPSLNWGITAGETKELPEDSDAQEAILERSFITEAGSSKSSSSKKSSSSSKSSSKKSTSTSSSSKSESDDEEDDDDDSDE